MSTILTPEKPKIDILKPAPMPAVVPGTISDPKIFESEDHAAKAVKKLGSNLPKPAEAVD
jgi:hypothetical protein